MKLVRKQGEEMKFKKGLKLWVQGKAVNPTPEIWKSYFHPMVNDEDGYEIRLKKIMLDTNAVTCIKCGHSNRPVIWLAKLLGQPKGANRIRISEQFMENVGAYEI